MPRTKKYDYDLIYKLAFVQGFTPKEIAEKLDMPDYRNVQRILRARADEVIRPERGTRV